MAFRSSRLLHLYELVVGVSKGMLCEIFLLYQILSYDDQLVYDFCAATML